MRICTSITIATNVQYIEYYEYYYCNSQIASYARCCRREIHMVVVEQGDKAPFRRAWLMNIGIHEARLRFGNVRVLCILVHSSAFCYN